MTAVEIVYCASIPTLDFTVTFERLSEIVAEMAETIEKFAESYVIAMNQVVKTLGERFASLDDNG